MFEPIVRSNGWDDVTAALQLFSHLDGDALNVALLVPESRRVVPGFLIKSLSDHYNAPGRLAEYKRQFQRAFRCPRDDPLIFATELETQLQMVRDRFIDGQEECALRRHWDSLGPNTPMTDIVDGCGKVTVKWKFSHGRARRDALRAICQVTEVKPAPATSPETATVEDIIRKLLPTPALPASVGGPDTVGPGCPHPATDGSDMPTNAGGTGAIGGDCLGNLVTELASGRNSHGGGRCFAGFVSRFRRGVFFVRGFDPYDGPMPNS